LKFKVEVGLILITTFGFVHIWPIF